MKAILKAFKSSIYIKIILYTSAIIYILLIGCESPQDMNRDGDKMDGFIIYKDSNLIPPLKGFYSVSIYRADLPDPFSWVPVRTDSLKDFYKRDQHYEAMISVDGIPAGKYFVAATWSRYPRVADEIPVVLGTYGCDTNRNCTNHKVVEYPNYQGNFRNIHAWTDTTRKLN